MDPAFSDFLHFEKHLYIQNKCVLVGVIMAFIISSVLFLIFVLDFVWSIWFEIREAST